MESVTSGPIFLPVAVGTAPGSARRDVRPQAQTARLAAIDLKDQTHQKFVTTAERGLP